MGPMKIFYGWRVVAAACGIQFLLAALMVQSFGLYIAVLAEDMGWSKTALAGGAALQSAETALLGPMLGWLLDRFGPRRMIRTGMVCLGAGLWLLSQVQSLPVFYASAVLMSVGASLSGYFPLSIAVVHWFEKQRARALSMMTVGLAVGGLMSPLLAWSMQHLGWRETAMVAGTLAWLVGLPLAGLTRHRPAELGLHPDGIAPTPRPPQADGSAPTSTLVEEAHHFTLVQALRTPAFWLLAAGHALALLVVSAVTVHAVTHMKEGLGHSMTAAGGFMMLLTLGQLGGVLLGAAMPQHLDKRKIAAACMLSHALGLLCLTYASHVAMMWAFALLHGVAWGLRGPYMQAIRADYFGTRWLGRIMGISTVLLAFGQMGGPLIAGMLADWQGDYRLGFSTLALLAALGSVAFWVARPPTRPKAARKPAN